MSRDKLELKIIQLFEDGNGFLVQLRVHNSFNEAAYREIINLLRDYEMLLESEKDINRHIAGFLFVLDSTLQSAAYHFSEMKHEDAERVGRSHAEALDLIGRLLPS